MRGPRRCGCGSALANAIMTAHDHIPPDARLRLDLFIDKYVARRAGKEATGS
jgi:hypothetical protein